MPFEGAGQQGKERPQPYYDPRGVLIDWRDGPGWTLADAHSGVLVTGAIGSGKSSGPGTMLRDVLLNSSSAIPQGCGGIVLHAKNGDCDEWVDACKKAGRERDMIRITPGGPHKFNFLDWIASWGDADRGPIATVSLLDEIATAVKPKNTGSGKSDDAFFAGAHQTKLTNLVQVCQLAGLPVALPLLRDITNSVPLNLAQGKDPKWKEGSACWHILREAYYNTANDVQARKDWAECKRYLLHEYVVLSEKTRSIIDIMFTDLVRPFLTRPLRPLFCEGTTVTPEICFAGKILLIDIPVQEYHQTAKLAALAFKRCFQLAIMRRSGPPGSLRPCFLFADEAQNFLSPLDTDYQAVARSAGGITCLLTQQVSSIREALGSADKAENLMANLTTKFFCQNSGQTAEYASNLIGERYTHVTDLSVGRNASTQDGSMADAGMSGQVSRKEEKRRYIEASAFQRLRRGGAANNYMVDTVVFAGGKMFAGSKEPQPCKILAFNQKG